MCCVVLSGSAQNPHIALISGTGMLCGRRKSLVLDVVSPCNGFAIKRQTEETTSPVQSPNRPLRSLA
jgi:hypothetical protein